MTGYKSEKLAAAAWARIYRQKSERAEHAAFIYTLRLGTEDMFYTGRTLKGMRDHRFVRANVVLAFIWLYVFESLKERFLKRTFISGFVHTHPKPHFGYTNRAHSREDMFLLRLP